MLSLYLNVIESTDERSKFEQIYHTYRKQMILVAKSFLHHDADAEDVVHTVFLNIAMKHMRLIQRLENPVDVRNYLLKATKNTALNELKRKGRTNLPLETIIEYELDNGRDLPDDAFLDLICAKADCEKVIHALLEMEEPYREILYYHFVMEMTVPEAAKHLGRNTATAKKQLVRGKKMLLSRLGLEE